MNVAIKEEKKLPDPKPYVDALAYVNAQAVLIERYTPPEKIGALFKPKELQKAEARSSVWGKILRVSTFETDDADVLRMRSGLKEGMWANFLVTNPIAGGLPTNTRCQLIAIQDVLMAIGDNEFNEHVKDKY